MNKESQWLSNWKGLFPTPCRNVKVKLKRGEKIAPVRVNSMNVLFQEGQPEEGIKENNKFFPNKTWIINTEKLFNNFKWAKVNDINYNFSLRIGSRKLNIFKGDVYLDFNKGPIFRIIDKESTQSDPPIFTGHGVWVEKQEFIKALTERIKPKAIDYVMPKKKRKICPICEADGFYITGQTCTVCGTLIPKWQKKSYFNYNRG
jgi:hypothetical protein